MKPYKIAVIPGDGVGPEVLKEGMKVLKQAAECSGAFSFEDTWFPWGCGYYLEHGQMMPGDGIRILEGFDAIYLGAVGDQMCIRDSPCIRSLEILASTESTCV